MSELLLASGPVVANLVASLASSDKQTVRSRYLSLSHTHDKQAVQGYLAHKKQTPS